MTAALMLCAVLAVSDGDTLHVDCPAMGPARVRLADVDAPELGCASAEAARAALAALAGAQVWVAPRYRDRWGRLVADVATVEHEDVAGALVALGRAWPWPHDDRGRALALRPQFPC